MIARAYLKQHGYLPSKGAVADEIEELGLKPVPVESAGKLRSCLEHLGDELYKNALVELRAKAGLVMDDVIVKK